MLHVPYKGGALAINGALASTVYAMFAVMSEALQHFKSGKFTELGVMSPQRLKMLTNVPNLVESGLADMNLSAWIGLLAPAKMPKPIINQLNRGVVAIDAALKSRLAGSAMEFTTSTPEGLQQLIARGVKVHAELVEGCRAGAAKNQIRKMRNRSQRD